MMACGRRRSRKEGQQNGVSFSSTPFPTSISYNSSYSTPSLTDSGSLNTGGAYFAQFTDFEEDIDSSLANQVARLGLQEKWSKKEMKRRLLDAFDTEFAHYFGTDTSKVEKWQEMCRICLIEDIPTSITKCKKALAKIHINIFNFLDHLRNPNRFELHVFSSVRQLRNYTVPDLIYPLKRAKEHTFTKALLRPVKFTQHKRAA